jgi:hypothetical protein
MRKTAKELALSLLRALYFMFATSAMLWLICNYAGFNATTTGILALGAAYGLLTAAAALNVVRKGKFLSGSSIGVLSVGTQRFLRILGLAFAVPALLFCGNFAFCVATFDGTTNAIERMKSVENIELTVFGKSVIGRYIYGNPTPPTLEAANDVDFGPYMANMQRKIKRNWFPPKANTSKRVVVLFTLSRDGTMNNLRTLTPDVSDSELSAAYTAVQSTKFQSLPQGSPDSVDIEFTFDYNVFTETSNAGVFPAVSQAEIR